ncbi:valacyclovir hydrolase, putative [Ixodes scapularis]|uniref:Valacyclovir hydrolase, putative n=1 Tax=Ixodes scapularis TaxID=6945 RepID=B7PLM9_IXOSC|nr:valacyclovir hydrolase, putative [Ixodes scapularis]|eukprot:XP_002434677.1 valacyclovir hydrolase, putative [Ixodes scapularis]
MAGPLWTRALSKTLVGLLRLLQASAAQPGWRRVQTELAKIRCPTLIVHGGKDPLVTPEHPAYLLRHIALSKLCVIPEGKHNLHLKFPDDFNKLVTDIILG